MAHVWVKLTSSTYVPPQAIIGGHDIDNDIVYVGRAILDGNNVPAKVIPNKKCAFVCWRGIEYKKETYEILTGNMYKWMPWAGGLVPPNSVIGGYASTGEALYVGRGYWRGSLTVGKIVPSHHCLYIPFDGKEHRLDTYDVLTYFSQQSVEDKKQVVIWAASSGSSFVKQRALPVDNTTCIYVGRAWHNGDLLPAKVIADKKCAFVCYGAYEVKKSEFEVLIRDAYKWKSADGGHIPPGAVEGGRTAQGEPLYIGRTLYCGSMTMGKIQQSHGCIYIGLAGQAVPIKNYEVLVK